MQRKHQSDTTLSKRGCSYCELFTLDVSASLRHSSIQNITTEGKDISLAVFQSENGIAERYQIEFALPEIWDNMAAARA